VFSKSRVAILMSESLPTEPSEHKEGKHMNRFIDVEWYSFDKILGGNRGHEEDEQCPEYHGQLVLHKVRQRRDSPLLRESSRTACGKYS